MRSDNFLGQPGRCLDGGTASRLAVLSVTTGCHMLAAVSVRLRTSRTRASLCVEYPPLTTGKGGYEWLMARAFLSA